jgi:hypothetical protein
MKCPFCSEEIKDDAKKCRFCGEWLSNDFKSQESNVEKDNSNLKMYKVCLLRQNEKGKEYIKYQLVAARTQEGVKKTVSRLFSEYQMDEKYGMKSVAEGKYTCPSCKSRYTICKKNIGCAILILIFVSLGLGLIIIPFLPYHCTCQICNYKWKA